MKIEFKDTLIFNEDLIKKIRKIQNKALVIERLTNEKTVIIYDEGDRFSLKENE
jgi:hypothetical protein